MAPESSERGAARESGDKSDVLGLWVATGHCLESRGLEFSAGSAPLGRVTPLAFVQETVPPGARKEPGWPGL